MPKVKALQVLKDKNGYHEVGETFEAAKAVVEEWIERGSAEAVSGSSSKGKGKAPSQKADSGAQGGDSGEGDTAALIDEYGDLHAQAIEAGTFEHAKEAEAQIRELGEDATADQLQAVREFAEGGGE